MQSTLDELHTILMQVLETITASSDLFEHLVKRIETIAKRISNCESNLIKLNAKRGKTVKLTNVKNRVTRRQFRKKLKEQFKKLNILESIKEDFY